MTLSKLGARPLWAILAVYTVLALAYNFAQPPLEPPDEAYQFTYVRYLIEYGQLPVVQLGYRSGFHHPPLYYALAALFAAPFPAQDFEEYKTARINPFQGFEYWRTGTDNKNRYLHGPWDALTWSNTALALHITRLISLFAGWFTLIATYRFTQRFFNQTIAFAATGLVAFLPMFLSISGTLQGDAGATAVGAALLWLGVKITQTDLKPSNAMLIGTLVGVGALIKLTAAFLLFPALWLVLDWAWHMRPGWRVVLQNLALVLGSAGLVSGWWFARNYFLYGDPTAMNVNLEVFGGQTLAQGIANWGPALSYAWTTFWGRFAHGEVNLPEWVYQFLTLPALLAVAGIIKQIMMRPPNMPQRALRFLAVAGLVQFAALVGYLTLSPTGANARYTFPALPAYMLLGALGLLAWLPARWHFHAGRVLVTGMLAFSVYALAGYIIPAYAPPPAVAQLPANATPLNTRLWDIAIIRGYVFEVPPTAGKTLTLTVYWEPLSRTDLPYSVFVHLIDSQTQTLIAQRDTYPGLGRYPTTAWEPGQLFADRYQVVVPENVVVQSAYWKVGLWQAETGDRAWVLDSAGELIDSGQRLAEFTWPLPAR
jgi:4-amino-4-deoxy-L-arabinose transferase-like glycosyltransferase